MAGSAPPRWPVVVVVAGAVVLLVAAARLAGSWGRSDLATADQQASVLSALLAAAVAMVALTGWAWRRRQLAALPATAEQVDHAVATLAGAVREQWQAEAATRSLGDPEPMPVRWRLTSANLMDDPAVIQPDGTLVLAGRSDRVRELADAFRALPRRRLVITGGPGTGKTTLAVQLLLELLPPPGMAPTDPVPVLLSLTDWSPRRQPRLQDWLTAQVERTYPGLRAISPDAAAALVAQGRVLPVLDGLDEVPRERRARIVAALNASLHPDGGLILTSRREEYRDALAGAGAALTGAAVVAPFALTAAEAADHLRKQLPPGELADQEVLTVLAGGGAPSLAAVTSNPLGLWLVRAVYVDPRQPLAPLVDRERFPDARALRAHLLDELVPAVLRSRPPLARRLPGAPDAPMHPARRHRPEDVRRVLSVLAEQMRAGDTRDWRWWDLAPHTFATRGTRVALRAAVGVVSALVVAAGTGSMFGPVFAYVLGVPMAELGMVYGTVGGLAVGLIGGLRTGVEAAPRHVNLRLRGRIRELLGNVAAGVVVWFAVGAGLWALLVLWLLLLRSDPSVLAEEVTTRWLGLSMLVVMIGLTFVPLGGALGFLRVIRSSARAEPRVSPHRSYTADLTLSAVEVLAIGIAAAMACGVVFRLWTISRGTLSLEALTFVVVFALALDRILAAVCPRAWFAFFLARGRLVLGRRLPVRVMSVLDDAHRMGLLRSVGPAYQFRHAELQDHLAPRDGDARAG